MLIHQLPVSWALPWEMWTLFSKKKVNSLQVMRNRLKHLSACYSILLLCNCFSISKLLYIRSTSPCFLSLVLKTYKRHPAIECCQLGICRAQQLSPSVRLASAAASSNLVQHILPSHFQGLPTASFNDVISCRSQILSALALQTGLDVD